MELSTKYIALKPYNGLGNRFRAISSCIVLANYLKIPLYIYWTSTRGFDDTKISEIIDYDNLKKKHDIRLIDTNDWKQIRGESVHLETKFSLLHEKTPYTSDTSVDTEHEKRKEEYVENIFNKRWNKLSVKTSNVLNYILESRYNEVLPEHWILHTEVLRDIKPSKKVLSMSSQTLKKFGDKVLGVHIRRGDATNTDFYSEHKHKYSSDLGKYIKRTQELLDLKYKKVFVATDCKESLQLFKRKFKDKCIVYEKDFNESVWHKQKQGQLDARVEQHLLSCTDYLLTSEWSTFSDFAKNYSNINSEII